MNTPPYRQGDNAPDDAVGADEWIDDELEEYPGQDEDEGVVDAPFEYDETEGGRA
jgi:hypothetical protein